MIRSLSFGLKPQPSNAIFSTTSVGKSKFGVSADLKAALTEILLGFAKRSREAVQSPLPDSQVYSPKSEALCLQRHKNNEEITVSNSENMF